MLQEALAPSPELSRTAAALALAGLRMGGDEHSTGLLALAHEPSSRKRPSLSHGGEATRASGSAEGARPWSSGDDVAHAPDGAYAGEPADSTAPKRARRTAAARPPAAAAAPPAAERSDGAAASGASSGAQSGRDGGGAKVGRAPAAPKHAVVKARPPHGSSPATARGAAAAAAAAAATAAATLVDSAGGGRAGRARASEAAEWRRDEQPRSALSAVGGADKAAGALAKPPAATAAARAQAGAAAAGGGGGGGALSGMLKSSRYVGVHLSHKHLLLRPWLACCWAGGKNHHLGYFQTEEDAATAYDAFAREHRKALNFADADKGEAPATKQVKASRYRGVHFKKGNKTKPWKAVCVVGGRQHHLGYHASEEAAAAAYDAFAAQHGRALNGVRPPAAAATAVDGLAALASASCAPTRADAAALRAVAAAAAGRRDAER
jgi:hypothetical protein